MLRALFGMAPQKEPDGSFRPSRFALKTTTKPIADYSHQAFTRYTGKRNKVVVLLTEEKTMVMRNGKHFSTGNNPVETFVPMLHLREAGFEFLIATPTGKPAMFEMWAMPMKDDRVVNHYREVSPQLSNPLALAELTKSLNEQGETIAAVFIPGGDGAMLGIPQDPNVGELLRWAKDKDRFTISISKGASALLATHDEGQSFLYEGYNMAVFPQAIDRKRARCGYFPGIPHWEVAGKLKDRGVNIVNLRPDGTCHVDRKVISGASSAASNQLGVLAAKELLRASIEENW